MVIWRRLFFAWLLIGLARSAAADPATNAPTAAPTPVGSVAVTSSATSGNSTNNASPALSADDTGATNASAIHPSPRSLVSSQPPAKDAGAAGDEEDVARSGARPVAYPGSFPRPLDSYGDERSVDVFSVLANRALAEPFNLAATIIFLLAIVHTFLAPKILAWSGAMQEAHELALQTRHGGPENVPTGRRQSIPAAILHFFGEVEVVLGLWVVPLAVVMVFAKGANVARHYFDQDVSYVAPLFVVVIMAIASSRPIIDLAVRLMGLAAGASPLKWWLMVLTAGPLLGSLITEPAAMTICALLLAREFYRLRPGNAFMYATLGLLFVNVSVGGALTSFAAPPLLIVAATWQWGTLYLLEHFGLRVIGGILFGNLVYFLIFRKEFAQLAATRAEYPPDEDGAESVPLWITAVHLGFLAWTVLVAHEPALFIGGFLFFVGFTSATSAHQDEFNLRQPMLVGFFLAGLVIHGGLQGWWIEPVLARLTAYPLLIGSTVLTAFNDNAAVTYLATLAPNLTDALKLAVVSGAVAGGGLTVIANAPNPAGQSLLRPYFPEGGIRPLYLFLAALFPTLVMLGLFALPR